MVLPASTRAQPAPPRPRRVALSLIGFALVVAGCALAWTGRAHAGTTSAVSAPGTSAVSSSTPAPQTVEFGAHAALVASTAACLIILGVGVVAVGNRPRNQVVQAASGISVSGRSSSDWSATDRATC